jgi:hypothetical protein
VAFAILMAHRFVSFMVQSAYRAREFTESKDNEQAEMALVTIAHCIGIVSFMAELEQIVSSAKFVQEHGASVERFLSASESMARAYSGWFYRGLTIEDLAQAFSARTQVEEQ